MPVKRKKQKEAKLQLNTIRVTRTGFAFVGVFLLTTIIYDSWNLITHEAVGRRWMSSLVLLVVTTAVWYFARRKSSATYYSGLIMLLAISQIIFASFNVYWDRGMASIMTILFVVPILTAGAIKKRTALIATAMLAAAGYSAAIVGYFFNQYGEGYRVQLWGTVFLVSATLFVVAWLAMILAGLRHDSP